jgi:hypothetical protein
MKVKKKELWELFDFATAWALWAALAILFVTFLNAFFHGMATTIWINLYGEAYSELIMLSVLFVASTIFIARCINKAHRGGS